jgi:hypothetical protein
VLKRVLEEMLHKKSRKNSNLVAYNEPQPTYDLQLTAQWKENIG